MALSINPATSVITVPKADLTLVSGTLYTYDVNTFRLALKALEDDPDYMPFPKTHTHNAEVVISGDTYARTVEILAPYTVEFEDGQYEVKLTGANHNIADVKVANQVSLIIGNSAGLISIAGGMPIADGGITSDTFAAGAIDANAIAAAAFVASKFGAGAIDATALATDAVLEIADALLDRDMAAGTDTGSATVRTVRQALRSIRNRAIINEIAKTITVYKEDDALPSWTGDVTVTSEGHVREVDPAS